MFNIQVLENACPRTSPAIGVGRKFLRAARNRVHSITTSKGTRTACGIFMPGALAVLMLTASWASKRRGERACAECNEKCATRSHSITLSARTRMDCGILMPSAFAVFMLITSSNLVGCSIGSSPGLAPLRILSANAAERCASAGRSTP